jgi:hypothetical protein
VALVTSGWFFAHALPCLQLRRHPCTVKRFRAHKEAVKLEVESDHPPAVRLRGTAAELRAVTRDALLPKLLSGEVEAA